MGTMKRLMDLNLMSVDMNRLIMLLCALESADATEEVFSSLSCAFQSYHLTADTFAFFVVDENGEFFLEIDGLLYTLDSDNRLVYFKQEA